MKRKKGLAVQVGQIMRENRIKLGLRQNEVGQKIRTSQAALSRMEHGKMMPTLIQWFEFCELSGVEPSSFWDNSKDN